MTKHFEHLQVIREHFDNIINHLSLQELNRIPEGFRNNIIWNIGHALVTQQLLVYGLSGNKMCFNKDFIETFRRGSEATQVTQETVDFIKKNLFSPILQMADDYPAGVLKTFKKYPTSFGLILCSVEDAIRFNNIHEGVHLGYAMALRKCI